MLRIDVVRLDPLAKHKSLKQACCVLYDLFKASRNKVVHAGGYQVQGLPYREPGRKKVFHEDYLIVRTRKATPWRIPLPDLFSIAHLVASVARLLGEPSPRPRDISDVYQEIKGLQTLGYLHKEKRNSPALGLKSSNLSFRNARKILV